MVMGRSTPSETPPYAATTRPSAPVTAVTAAGSGFRTVGADGSVYAFGRAGFFGSLGGDHLNQPVVGMAATDRGYVTVSTDGGVFTFGGVGFYGSLGASHLYRSAAAGTTWSTTGSPTPRRAAWDRVNICEEGGRWDVEGAVYSGGLGFSQANWAAVQHLRLSRRRRPRHTRAANPGGGGLRRPLLGEPRRRPRSGGLQRGTERAAGRTGPLARGPVPRASIARARSRSSWVSPPESWVTRARVTRL